MDPLTNDERIAALLDGRLSEQERAALLAELGMSRDELEILLDSAGITAELEEEDRAAGMPHITAPRPNDAEPRRITRPPVWRRPAVISAAAVVVLGLGSVVWMKSGRRTFPESVSPVAELSHPDAGLPDSLPDPWSATRGGSEALGTRRTSVRFGALATHMELAVRSGDRARFAAAAESAATLLQDDDKSPEARLYQAAGAGAKPPQLDSLLKLHAATAEALDRDMVALGRWAEAARVAARVGDARFFAGRESRTYLQGYVPANLPPSAVTALAKVRGAAPKGGTTSWSQLEQALTELLHEAA